MKLTPNILAMYLGCDAMIPSGGQIGKLTEVDINIGMIGITLNAQHHFYLKDKFKLVLRKLEEMTHEEAKEFMMIQGWGPELENIAIEDGLVRIKDSRGQIGIQYFRSLKAETFAYLLSKSFDLFGLIKSGEAIDAIKFRIHAHSSQIERRFAEKRF